MSFNYQALRDEILNSARNLNYSEYVVTPDMPKQNAFVKDSKIAELLNLPSGTQLFESRFNAVGLMSKLGAITASTILTKIELAQSTYGYLKWAISALNSDHGLNFGDPEMQAILDNLSTAGVITAEEAGLLKGLGIKESSIAYQIVGAPVTWAEVSIALRGGTEFEIGA